MSLRVGELHALLKLDDKGYYTGLNKAEGAFMALGRKLAVIAASAAAAITAAGVAAGAAGVKLAGDWEQANIAFTTMLGSGERAQAFMEGLQAFANKTPFELPGLIDASRKLMAFGFDAEKVLPMLTSIGDAVSAMGGGAVEIDRVTRAIGQMQAKGKVSAEEMNQLAELGINGWAALAQKFGKTQGEVMKMAEQGQIDAKSGIQALLDFMDSRFAGSMEKQSQTLIGLYSTLKDTVSARLREMGEEIVKTFDLKKKLAGAIKWLEDNKAKFIDWGKRLVTALSNVTEGTRKFVAKLLNLKDESAGVIAFGEIFVGILEKMAEWWEKNSEKIASYLPWVTKIAAAVIGLTVAFRALAIAEAIAQAMTPGAGWATLAFSLAAGAASATAIVLLSNKANAAFQDAVNKAKASLASTAAVKVTETTPGTKSSTEEVTPSSGDTAGATGASYLEKLIDLAQKVAQARKDAWASEIAAYRHNREQYLSITGKTYDAERLAAKHAYDEETAQINATATLGISTRQRLYEAYAKYYQAITNINQKQADAQKQMDEEVARKKMALEEQIYNFAKPLYLRMVELFKGESAAKVAAIEMERRERKRDIEQMILDKKEQADLLQQIDIDAQAQTNAIIQGLLNDQAKVQSDILDKRREDYDNWITEQRSKVQWIASGMDIWKNAVISSVRMQIGNPQLASNRISESQLDELRGISKQLYEINQILRQPNRPLMGF